MTKTELIDFIKTIPREKIRAGKPFDEEECPCCMIGHIVAHFEPDFPRTGEFPYQWIEAHLGLSPNLIYDPNDMAVMDGEDPRPEVIASIEEYMK